MIASCDAGGSVHIWDLRKMEEVLEIYCGRTPLCVISFSLTSPLARGADADGETLCAETAMPTPSLNCSANVRARNESERLPPGHAEALQMLSPSPLSARHTRACPGDASGLQKAPAVMLARRRRPEMRSSV